MILIFTINEDFSSSEVIKWFNFYKFKYYRINENDLINVIEIKNENIILQINNNEIIDLNNVKSVWYRRGFLNINYSLKFEKEYSINERNSLIEYIERIIMSKKSLNSFSNSRFNKLNIINYSMNKSFKIPNTLITSKKEEVLLFIDNYKKIISKPMSVPFSKYDINNNLYMSYTSLIKRSDLIKLPNNFIPTLFQEYINKTYEIRSFYLNKKFYSMAIFSQNNNRTKIDFRNYDDVLPNRVSCFKLPTSIEIDISKMLQSFDINSASLDLIFNDENYFLLDINPIGQFGMVSYPCNYNLEHKIFEYLTK